MSGKGFKFTSKIVRDLSSQTFPELRRRLKLMDAEVRVGLPAGKPHKVKKKDKSKSNKPAKPVRAGVAFIGAVHEFGSPEAGIPERPWLRPGIRSGTSEYTRLNRVNIIRILKGEITPQIALRQLGAMAVGKVQQFIRAGNFVPLKPQTIARKGSTAPLIDTAQMVQSVTFEVGEKTND
jgi:hypothetical protein